MFDILNAELDMCMTEGDIFLLQVFFVFICSSLLLVSFLYAPHVIIFMYQNKQHSHQYCLRPPSLRLNRLYTIKMTAFLIFLWG